MGKVAKTLYFNEKVYDRFVELCDRHGLKISGRIEYLMKMDMQWLIALLDKGEKVAKKRIHG